MGAGKVLVVKLRGATNTVAWLSRTVRAIYLMNIILVLLEKEDRRKRTESDTPWKTFPPSWWQKKNEKESMDVVRYGVTKGNQQEG
jgi:hypothetical protein